MSGLALGSFVEGFIRTDEIKNRRRESRMDRERQERLDALALEDRARQHSREDAADARSAWEHGQRVQAASLAEQERAAWAAAMQGAVPAVAPGVADVAGVATRPAPGAPVAAPPAAPPAVPMGAVPPPTMMAPPPRPALPAQQGPMPLPAMQGPPVAPPPSVMTAAPSMGPVSQVPPTMAGNVPIPFADARMVGAPMGAVPPASADAAYAQPGPGNMRGLEYQALLAAAEAAAPRLGPRPVPAVSVADSAALTQSIITPPGLVPPDVAAGPGPMAPPAPGTDPAWLRQAEAQHQSLTAGMTPDPNRAPGRQDAPGAIRPPARGLDAALPTQEPDPYARTLAAPPTEGAPVPTSPQEPPSTTGARGVVRQAAPSTPPADTPRGQTPTIADYPEQTVRRVADTAVQHWMETGLPQMQQFYLQTGQLDKLTALNEWASAEKTREGMRAWGQAVFAAELGDFDGFKAAIARAYNTLDYFGDGMTIIEDKSDFIRQGDAIVGARVTFRDEATGREIVQEFNGPGDLLMQGINMLAPEQAFEYRLKQIEAEGAAIAQRQQAIFEAQLKAGAAPDMAKRISDAIAERSKTDLAFAQMPMEQQVASAVEFIRLLDEAAAGGPPGAIQPGATPAGPAPAPVW